MATQYSRRLLLQAGASLVAGAVFLDLQGCAGSSGIFSPGVDAYVLDVNYAQRECSGVQIRTRCYNGNIPGPILRTAPGRTLKVTINNGLPPNPVMTSATSHEGNINNPHEFNTTNLHVHGLDVIPHIFEPIGTSNPDAPVKAIEPGTSFTYEFAIPEDHPSGMDWYHPHHHGSTAMQVFGGMAGLIIVEGPIDQVPEIKAARELLVGVQSLRVDPAVDDPDLYVMEPIAGKTAAEGGFKTGEFARTIYTVNGQAVGWKGPEMNAVTTLLGAESVEVRPGEVVRIRMLNGTDEQYMPVQVDGHTMHVIGYDGRNLLTPEPRDEVFLSPGNRLEFLIKAGEPGSYAFRQNPQDGQQFETSSGFVMLNLNVSGDPVNMHLPTTLPTPSRDYPLIDSSELVGAPHTVDFQTVFPYPELLTGVGFTINGVLYDENRIDKTSQRGTAEEWILTAGPDEGHPFHVHVNTFEVREINGIALDPPRIMDTVWVPKAGEVKIRMKFKEYTGKTLYHCHILIHEDTGMMQNLLIV